MSVPSCPRVMLSFAQDEEAQWYAELDCGHRRHVRHRPPLSSYPWVASEAGRSSMVGAKVECDRCAQRVWPEGFVPYKSTPSFNAHTLPAGLRGTHRTKGGVWGRLEVSVGEVDLVFTAPLDERVRVKAGEWAAIPAQLEHHLELALGEGALELRVRFCRRPDPGPHPAQDPDEK